MNHVTARQHVLSALRLLEGELGTATTLPIAQAVQGVAALESGYGTAWNGEGRGSFNMGAIQSGKPPCDPARSFLYTDTSPNDDGTSTPYQICFARYPHATAGFVALVRTVYIGSPDPTSRRNRRAVLAAAARGDLYGVSEELYRSGYYEGFGRRVEDRIRNHHRAMLTQVTQIASALNESMPDGSSAPPPTIRRGSPNRAAVHAWQMVLRTPIQGWPGVPLVADGAFGPLTERATKDWQRVFSLKADGIVGPATWAKAEEYFGSSSG